MRRSGSEQDASGRERRKDQQARLGTHERGREDCGCQWRRVRRQPWVNRRQYHPMRQCGADGQPTGAARHCHGRLATAA